MLFNKLLDCFNFCLIGILRNYYLFKSIIEFDCFITYYSIIPQHTLLCSVNKSDEKVAASLRGRGPQGWPPVSTPQG